MGLVADYTELLTFWFGEDADQPFAHVKKWWTKDREFDKEVRDRFGLKIAEAKAGKLEDWKTTPRGTLAFIIVLDQFSRNAFRDTADAFAGDDLALGETLRGISMGTDYKLKLVERHFFYMPLMHSEDLERQEQAVQKFGVLAEAAPIELRSHFEDALHFAKKHRNIVAEFGHFPHRNKILGRAGTPAEVEFLKKPGSSF